MVTIMVKNQNKGLMMKMYNFYPSTREACATTAQLQDHFNNQKQTAQVCLYGFGQVSNLQSVWTL